MLGRFNIKDAADVKRDKDSDRRHAGKAGNHHAIVCPTCLRRFIGLDADDRYKEHYKLSHTEQRYEPRNSHRKIN